MKLEETEEYKALVEASKANMRAIIKRHHFPEQAATTARDEGDKDEAAKKDD